MPLGLDVSHGDVAEGICKISHKQHRPLWSVLSICLFCVGRLYSPRTPTLPT